MKEQDAGVKWFNTVFYPKNRTARAVRYEDGVLPRLRREQVILFTPWGPRYKWRERGIEIREDDREMEVLRLFRLILDEWQAQMPQKKFEWIFLAADLYGMRINSVPEESVRRYFTSVRVAVDAVFGPRAQTMLWSSFDELAKPYRERAEENLIEVVPWSVRKRAQETARRMGGGNPREYLIERLAEAMFFEELYEPIKVSAVGRHKDEGVDGPLPRLYFVPEKLHAPWF